jgi:hypothetical protein
MILNIIDADFDIEAEVPMTEKPTGRAVVRALILKGQGRRGLK